MSMVPLLALLAPALALASMPADKPAILRCRAVSNIGCDGDICIADAMIDRNPVTYNLRANRYSSAVGKGWVTQQWDLPDGRHAIRVSSPPASAEFTFSADWSEASAGGSVGYACERLEG